jgi:DnaJ-domain-containing protein 1
MTDYFALMSEPRRPWLEADTLKAKFIALSAETHPDKAETENEAERAVAAGAFAEVNAAYHALADPKLRLLHLLELESGVKPGEIQQIPASLADLFAEVATACQSTDRFLAEKSLVTSPLLHVHWFERSQEWVERLNVLQQKLNGLHGQVVEQLKKVDAKWTGADTAGRQALLPALEELYRLFGYFSRWSRQIQERVLQLMV